ncbi:MAG: MCE family protein [Ideonella sp.]|jgi:phospholipid/cholesterol/gamma-HCH transport system substrate-binding protein|nr:MCE family protein [Ideonella sp.]
MTTPLPKVERQRSQITGLLLVAALLAALLIGGVAYKQGAFVSREQVYFIADDVTGLAPGTAVRMSGFRVGKVLDLQIQDDLQVKVVLAVDAGPYGHLRSDARANVVREQLRPPAIDLRAGSAATPLSASDPRVAFGRRGTLTEIADDFRARVVPILDDVKQLTGVALERKGDIDAVLRNASALSTAMVGTAEQLHAVSTELRNRTRGLGEQSETAMLEVNQMLLRVSGLLVQAEKSLEAVNGKLPGMLNQSEQVIKQLDGVMRDTRTISAAAATGLPPLLRSAPPLVEDSRDLLQGVRQSWPMRNLLPAPPPPLLPIDSHDPAALRDPAPR